MRTHSTSAKPFLIALGVVAVLLLGGFGALAFVVKNAPPTPASESSARKLLRELLPGGNSLALTDRAELRDGDEVTGYSWRISPEVSSIGNTLKSSSAPTYFGVVACVEGDRATAGVRYSLLRWIPRGCDGSEPQLERKDRTPEEALGSIADQIGPPDASDQTEALKRVAR